MYLPLEILKDLYALELTSVKKVDGGYLSENYELTNGLARYFLKKHRSTEQKEVAEVLETERFFAKEGIPVILPIQNRNDYFFEYQNGYYSLYPFVQGNALRRGKLSETASVSLGKTLAEIHLRGKESKLAISRHFKAWDTDSFLSKAARIEQEVLKENPISEFGHLILQSLKQKKEEVLQNTISFEELGLANDHLIHGDYFCDNVFFDTNDHINYVFDFEKVQYAPPGYELFRSLFVSFLSVPTEQNLKNAKKYIESYRSVYNLPEEVLKKSLFAAYVRQIHSLWIEEEHYLLNNHRPDALLPTQMALNKFYLSDREAIDTYLLS